MRFLESTVITPRETSDTILGVPENRAGTLGDSGSHTSQQDTEPSVSPEGFGEHAEAGVGCT